MAASLVDKAKAVLWATRWPAFIPMFGVPVLFGALFHPVYCDSAAFPCVIDLEKLVLTLAWAFLVQASTCLWNDHMDVDVDEANTTYIAISGGSRVVPDKRLTVMELAFAASCASLLALTFGVYLGWLWTFYQMVFHTIACIMFGLMYNAHFSYQGYGEAWQGFCVGFMLPLVGYHVQSQTLDTFPFFATLPLICAYYAGNIITALPDVPSDAVGFKQTYPVQHGGYAARVRALKSIATGAVMLWLQKGNGLLATLPVLTVVYLIWRDKQLLIKADVEDSKALCTQFVRKATIAQFTLVWLYLLYVVAPTG